MNIYHSRLIYDLIINVQDNERSCRYKESIGIPNIVYHELLIISWTSSVLLFNLLSVCVNINLLIILFIFIYLCHYY